MYHKVYWLTKVTNYPYRSSASDADKTTTKTITCCPIYSRISVEICASFKSKKCGKICRICQNMR